MQLRHNEGVAYLYKRTLGSLVVRACLGTLVGLGMYHGLRFISSSNPVSSTNSCEEAKSSLLEYLNEDSSNNGNNSIYSDITDIHQIMNSGAFSRCSGNAIITGPAGGPLPIGYTVVRQDSQGHSDEFGGYLQVKVTSEFGISTNPHNVTPAWGDAEPR